MANELSAVAPRLLAQGLMALRNMNSMPMLVNGDYSSEFASKGISVDVPVPSALAVSDVTPAAVPPQAQDSTPTFVPVVLDQWKEAPFFLSDRDIQNAMDGIIPMQASEAAASLADEVNSYILTVGYRGFFSATGTAGTTPFATATTAATDVRKALNIQKAPRMDRRAVLDPDAEANALGLRAFQDSSWSASPRAITEGDISRKFGFDWYGDQQIPTHTGTDTSHITSQAGAVGDTTLTVDGGGSSQSINAGDLITFAGHTTVYKVWSGVSGASGSISFGPGLTATVADNAAITVSTTQYTANLAFQRNAIAFVNRPLADVAQDLGSIMQTAQDPVSGIIMRLEISREHKQTRFSYDMLYGASVVRPELGVVLLG